MNRRRRQVESLGTSELSRALLTTHQEPVLVLDRQGNLVTFNAAGWDYVRTLYDSSALEPGRSYLSSYHQEDETDARLKAGIESVLDGSRDELTLEFCRRSAEPRWFSMVVVRLRSRDGGAIVSQTDITERKLSEEESRRGQEELAHRMRVSMLGELVASLAHELNQPLAAMRSNAQAALRFLSGPNPNLDEARAALNDIVEDNRWATEVIRRLRMMVHRGEGERAALDLNDLLRETFELVRTLAIERNIAVRLQPAPSLPSVLGDRVQLQQVLLNLVLNAFDAIDQEPEGPRELDVWTSADTPEAVTVAVRDSGAGVGEDDLERIFAAFYTTKPEGMGLGLSISRTIVKSHGGRLWATRNPDRGTTVFFTVPVPAGA